MKVIAHVDLDAFYTQVEIARDPNRLAGQPVVVIQYNPFGDLSTLRPDEDRIKPESNGSIIAVSYEARKHGVKRNMMAQQAKKLCPTLQIVQVPVAHGKADLTIYRDAGAAVINILSKHAVCERASIDEAYMDVTAAAQQLLTVAKKGRADSSKISSNGGSQEHRPQAPAAATGMAAVTAGQPDATSLRADEELQELADDLGVVLHALPCPESFEGWHVAGLDPQAEDPVRQWWCRPSVSWAQSDSLLAAGALVVARARAAVKASLGFSCSAGIAHSKILAKLGSGLHKPDQQTLVPAAAVSGLLAPLSLSKLRQLGGKFGEAVMAKLDISTVGELAAVPLPRLEAAVGVQDAAWLQRLAQGQDGEEVKPRVLPKSISCGKTFRGQNVLTGLTAVHHWLLKLAQELQERVEADRQQHERLPKLLTVSFDSAPLDDEAGPNAAAAAAAAAGAAGDVQQGSVGSSIRGGPNQGRLNAQNWRAGAINISRSCAMRHARADAIAQDALGLVKKWARDRPNGFRIVTMFVSVSNFSLAPTGASTLERFFKAPAAAAATTEPATAAGPVADPASTGPDIPDFNPQRNSPHLQLAGQHGPSAAVAQPKVEVAAVGALSATEGTCDRAALQQTSSWKRPAASQAAGSRHRKAARTDRSQSDLRTLLVAASSAPGKSRPSKSAPAPAPGDTAAAAAAASVCADTAALLPVHQSHEGSVLQADGSEASQLRQRLSDAHTDVDSSMNGTIDVSPAGLPALAGATGAQPSHTVTPTACKPPLSALSAIQTLGIAALQESTALCKGPQPYQQPAQAERLVPPAAGPAASLAQQQHAWHTSDSQGPYQQQHQEGPHQEDQQQEQQQQPSVPRHQAKQLSPNQQQVVLSARHACAEESGLEQGAGSLLPVPAAPQCRQQHSPEPVQPGAGPADMPHVHRGLPAPDLAVPHSGVSFPAAGVGAASNHKQEPRDGVQHRPQEQQAPATTSWMPARLQLADIDPEVMAALPWEVQMEVQQQLRANRNAVRSGHAQATSRGRRGRAGSAASRGGSGARARSQQVPAGATMYKFLKK